MNIAIIGDIHSGVRGSLQVFADQQKNYFMNEFWPEIDRNEIRTIICSGDLFDKRKNIDFRILSDVRKYIFDEMERRNIQFFIIPGNHDTVFRNTNSLNSLDLLLGEYVNKNFVHIIHNPETLLFDNMEIGFVPWMNSENYDSCVKYIQENSHLPLLIGHFEMTGLSDFSEITEGINVSVFSDYQQVISGHYHKPIIEKNIWYPGSPLEFTWADYDQQKGFVILNTETQEINKIVTKQKMFHKVFYDDKDEFKLRKQRKNFTELRDKYVKVIVKNRSNRTMFDSWMNELYEKGKPYNVSVVDVTVNNQLTEEEIRIETLSTIEIIDNAIDSMIIDVSKDSLKTLFHDLYKESLEMEV